MARKKPKEEQTSTAVVRVEADLARMASIIATATDRDVSAVLSPLLRNALESLYAKTVRELGNEIPEERAKK